MISSETHNKVCDERDALQIKLDALVELGKECYVEAYSYELEYPSTPWSRLLFKVAKALGGDK